MAPILPRLDVEEDVEEDVIEIQKHDKVGDKDEVAGVDIEEVGVDILRQNSALSSVRG